MLTVFQVCFWVGVGMTALNAFLGLVFGVVDFGLDIDFDFDIHLDFDIGLFFPLSPALFFLWPLVFGGTGQIFVGILSAFWPLLPAFLIAFAVSSAINILVVRPLKRLSSKESATNSDFVGINAVVADKIFKDGYGKIHFVFDGNTISGPAKTSDGGEVPSGTEVAIMAVEGSVYVVERLDAPKSKPIASK